MLRPGIILASLIILRCGDPVSPPVVTPTVSLSLSLSSNQGAPTDVVVATARVVNRLEQPVVYLDGCGGETGVWFEVYDQRGIAITVVPPNPQPQCAGRMEKLRPLASLELQLPFDGTLYDANGLPYKAPAGRYVFFARFRWWDAAGGANSVVQEQRAVLTWKSR